MADLNLEPGEYAMASLVDVSINRGGYTTDLVLTNKNLLVVSKTVFGRTKGIKKYRLDQIPVVNGQAQLRLEKLEGYRQFTILLKTGEQLQVSSAQNEDYVGFGSQINLLLTGTPTMPTETDRTVLGQFAETVQSTFAAFDPRTYFGGKKNSATANQQQQMSNTPQSVLRQCAGCHAPISGYSGQVVVCGYCDTEQRL